jgi:hypothetical protein
LIINNIPEKQAFSLLMEVKGRGVVGSRKILGYLVVFL